MSEEHPKRRHIITIEIGADTWEDVIDVLDQIAFDIAKHEPGTVRIDSGAPHFGYSVREEFYPEQTHDNYIEEIHKYLENKPLAENEKLEG